MMFGVLIKKFDLQSAALSCFQNLFCLVDNIDLDSMNDIPVSQLNRQACDNLTALVSYSEDIWRLVCSAFNGVAPNSKHMGILIIHIPKSLLQGGFVPDRGTSNNIIIAQEILHFMKHTRSKKDLDLCIKDLWENGNRNLDMVYYVILDEVRQNILNYIPSSHGNNVCPLSQAIWRILNFIADNHDLKSWIFFGKNHNHFMFFSALWWIWRYRNNATFNLREPWSSDKIPPTSGTVKINRDASRFNYGGLIGFGCVIRNWHSMCRLGCAGIIPPSSILQGELRFLLFGEVFSWLSGGSMLNGLL
ncbi:hypothetical protein PIB30_062124 [Stylosanthes scabra]|uniref:Uncharacterized protein n=1 Tax=Stylosanthes scabra TaxID=79078 RepID=A0ABU6XK05_9FABA|nr:hypothetical protein [Stylosanthes scabra]